MAPRGRPGISAAARAELWTRFKAGESFTAIARALGKPVGSIYGVVRLRGGIVPVPRRRAVEALTSAERETITRGLAAGDSVRRIAQGLVRAPSTISREIMRNGGRLRYRALDAEARAWDQARRPKPCKLAATPALCALVTDKLEAKWSPEQIAGWLVTEYPDDPAMRVSTETIYRSLFVQARGALKRELTAHLRTRRPMRRSKRATTAANLGGRSLVRYRSPSGRQASKTARSRVTGREIFWRGHAIATSRRSWSGGRAICNLCV